MKILATILTVAMVVVVVGTAQAGTEAYRNTVLADNPIVYFEFDETSGTTATNSGSSGAAQDGTIANGVLLDQATFESGGGSFWFDGVNDFVTAAPFNALEEWSVEAWVNIDEDNTTENVIFGTDIGGYSQDVMLGIDPYSTAPNEYMALVVQNYMDNIGEFRTAADTGVTAIESWIHVVGTASTNDGGTLVLYIDGDAVDTQTSQGTITMGNGTQAQFDVGARGQGAGRYPFKGYIDELAVYGTTLDAATVGAHFKARVPSPGTLIYGK